jgi:amidohydrolase
MAYRTFAAGVLCGFLTATSAFAQHGPDSLIDRGIASFVAAYKKLHAAPELSHYEVKTSAYLADELRSSGYDVTEHVGKYDRPEWVGYGVVAVMKNGNGPTVLVRTELDALPVEEKTGLPYASSVRTKDEASRDVSVMHACGHDLHMASLLGTANVLSRLKGEWHGTLVFIGQPAEEAINGAKAMLSDGLYARFPRPDFVLALHSSPLEAGKVGYTAGYTSAGSSSVDITIRGIGGHGANPDLAKDPIVVAAQVVLALQTIVSRENSPLDPVVVTVGTIHGGTRRNIIPDEVNMQLTVRTYKEEVRRKVLASIERITKGVALAAGIPADLAPVITVSETETVESLYNDPGLTARLAAVFRKTLGPQNVVEIQPKMTSEDFGLFGLDAHQIPVCQYTLGALDPVKVESSRKTGTALPGNHSPMFAPLPEPALRTGIRTMVSAVLDLMKK